MSPSIGARALGALAALCLATMIIGLATGLAPTGLDVTHALQA